MGMWIELGIFGLVLVFGFWQLLDLRQERRKRDYQRKISENKPPDDLQQEKREPPE